MDPRLICHSTDGSPHPAADPVHTEEFQVFLKLQAPDIVHLRLGGGTSAFKDAHGRRAMLENGRVSGVPRLWERLEAVWEQRMAWGRTALQDLTADIDGETVFTALA